MITPTSGYTPTTVEYSVAFDEFEPDGNRVGYASWAMFSAEVRTSVGQLHSVTADDFADALEAAAAAYRAHISSVCDPVRSVYRGTYTAYTGATDRLVVDGAPLG